MSWEFFGMFRSRDMAIASLFVGIIFIIVIPLSPWMLDLLLIVNIGFSLMVLLTTLFTTGPLQFSVFPTMLLAATLFRLALNIASTRLILNSARAGAVISAFGGFVVGGNYLVGLIIFIIITLIQFIVITNGAGRVAEVAARFALDAMPGKQMSIDADLNVGLINEHDARKRRKEIQQEADFFGAMDGASKFVKGDAIAGIIITLVNLLGGLVIGMVQLSIPAQAALERYALLTVGDGLVSQIPALLISTATGVLVTRAGAGDSFGNQFSRQILNFPAGIALTGVVLIGLGLLPSLPLIPFAMLGAAAGYSSFLLSNQEQEKEPPASAPDLPEEEPENVLSLLSVNQVEIELGYGLLRMAAEETGGDLMPRLGGARKRFMNEMGLYLRPIRVRDNLNLSVNQYQIILKGNVLAQGEVRPGNLLAMESGGDLIPVPGIKTTDPAFGLPALWIDEGHREQAEINGYTVVDCTTVLITHLVEVIRQHSDEVLGRQEVKDLLDKLKETHPAVVEDVLSDCSLGDIQKILQQLLSEKIPLRDLPTIIEASGDALRQIRDPNQAIELVRKALSRTITNLARQGGDSLRVITLATHLEQSLLESLQNAGINQLVMSPAQLESLLSKLSEAITGANWAGREPVLLCSGRLRPALKKLTRRHYPALIVIAATEVLAEAAVEVVGVIEA